MTCPIMVGGAVAHPAAASACPPEGHRDGVTFCVRKPDVGLFDTPFGRRAGGWILTVKLDFFVASGFVRFVGESRPASIQGRSG
ncbi:MAG: hypothetical protein ACOYYJ_15710 [Chloroflexota bacterium]